MEESNYLCKMLSSCLLWSNFGPKHVKIFQRIEISLNSASKASELESRHMNGSKLGAVSSGARASEFWRASQPFSKSVVFLCKNIQKSAFSGLFCTNPGSRSFSVDPSVA